MGVGKRTGQNKTPNLFSSVDYFLIQILPPSSETGERLSGANKRRPSGVTLHRTICAGEPLNR